MCRENTANAEGHLHVEVSVLGDHHTYVQLLKNTFWGPLCACEMLDCTKKQMVKFVTFVNLRSKLVPIRLQCILLSLPLLSFLVSYSGLPVYILQAYRLDCPHIASFDRRGEKPNEVIIYRTVMIHFYSCIQ